MNVKDYAWEDRKKFIQKVYAILSVQLLITVGFITVAQVYEGVADWMNDYWWITLPLFFVIFDVAIKHSDEPWGHSILTFCCAFSVSSI